MKCFSLIACIEEGGAEGTAFLSAEDAEGHGELLFFHGGHGELPFCPRRTRRGAENGERQFLVVSFQFLVERQWLVVSGGGNGSFDPRSDAENRSFCPRRGAESIFEGWCRSGDGMGLGRLGEGDAGRPGAGRGAFLFAVRPQAEAPLRPPGPARTTTGHVRRCGRSLR